MPLLLRATINYPMNCASHPLISVVIAVYNGADTLQQCLDSVVQQTYPNVELIVIDGGSRDGTVELLESYQTKIRYWVSEPDRGIYSAWNKALLQVKGEWVCFLGADDFLWDQYVLSRMASQLVGFPLDINLAYGTIMVLSQEGECIRQVGEPWNKVKDRFKQLMCVPHPGAMHRKKLFDVHGGFDESFRIAGDYELLLRELKSADAAFIPDLIVVGMRQGGVSSTPRNMIKSLLEVRRAQRRHGQKLPGVLWLLAIMRVSIRLMLYRVLGAKAANKVIDAGLRVMKLGRTNEH